MKTSRQLADEAIERNIADEAATKARIAAGGSYREEDLLPLSELEDQALQAIVRSAKTGGNELAQREAKEAQNILDNRAESVGVAEEERRFREYHEGRETREDRDRQDLRDAGRAW